MPSPPRRHPSRLSRLALAGSALVVLSLLAACGGGGASAGASSDGAAAAQASPVSVREVPDVGRALVNAEGMTLYAEDDETARQLRCTDTCLGFWFPVTAERGVPLTGNRDLTAKLDTVKRADNGQTQVTFEGKPLYTFRLDTSPGSAKGDGFTDDFDGKTFDWHAATVGSGIGATTAPDNGSGGMFRY